MKIVFFTTSTFSDIQEVQSECIKKLFPESEHIKIDGTTGWFNVWYEWLNRSYKYVADWYIHLDEDCFVTSKEEIENLIQYMTENDLDIDRQKKIVALPEQIGKVVEYVEHENENSLWSSRKKVNLNIEHINEILNNQGDCKIQMITFEGDYCGYRIPKLEENKIIIEI
jgi:hypothetical protein